LRIFPSLIWLIHPCDGQTDGRAIAYRPTRYSIYALACKNFTFTQLVCRMKKYELAAGTWTDYYSH